MVFTNPHQPCYIQFFVNGNPSVGLRTGINLGNIKYICQQVNGLVYYATMFDERQGIAVFSAYLILVVSRSLSLTPAPITTFSDFPAKCIGTQGSTAIYQTQGQQIDKGHLVPGATYSSTRDSACSTYVYTNAVPQYRAFNRGLWAQFEARVRAFAPQCTGNGGRLYLLTGTSFLQNTTQGVNTPPVVQLGPAGRRNVCPAISIPNSMRTTGCCVLPNGVRSFAVFGNNVPNAAQSLTQQMSVASLENILLRDVLHHAMVGQPFSLFP
ncbi:unnamed protein product, partial [Pocillopora meandrina]